LFLVLFAGLLCRPISSAAGWNSLGQGIELGEFELKTKSPVGNSEVVILRIDPRLWDLAFYCIGEKDIDEGLTAKEWCEQYGLVAAINAGMYAKDHRTHVGYLRQGDYVNNARVNTQYKSVAAFGPRRAGVPPFRIFDLDDGEATIDSVNAKYSSVVQNLRLIKRPGENRWKQQSKVWSEAALAEDDQGRVLFILCRSPYSMHDLNTELLSLGIGIVCAQHLEGGPEAQLYVSVEALEKFGSYETNFIENDTNSKAWQVPNVIGVVARER
jgi:hypothetical protein